MNRRVFISSAALSLLGFEVAAQTDVLRDTFGSLPTQHKRWVQTQLHLMGVYAPYTADGRFGPITRTALVQAADLIAARTNGEMVFDLSNPSDARRYLDMMAQEQFMFIYDDGYEG